MSKHFVIYGAKQVGRLSHFTKDISTLIAILKSRQLIPGKAEEYNPNTGTEGRSVSFSRDMLAAVKRSSKWKYGLIIDGNQLSENYNVSPYSYEEIYSDNIKYKVRTLTAYDNDTYTVTFVRRNTLSISRDCYEWIRGIIQSQDEAYNAKCKLTYQPEGKRRIKGKMIREKFHYGSPEGGAVIFYKDMPMELKPYIDEYEERFWETPKQKSINLNGRIVEGLILPRKVKSDFESGEDEDMRQLKDLMDNLCGADNYTVMYY